MQLSNRTPTITALLLGVSLLFACETYKKAPEESAPQAAAPSDDDSTGPGRAAPAAGEPAAVKADPAAAKTAPSGAVGDGASCAAVADNVIKVAMSQPNLAPEQLERMKQLEARQRQVITQTCDTTPWPADFRNCLATAASSAEIQACRKFEPKP